MKLDKKIVFEDEKKTLSVNYGQDFFVQALSDCVFLVVFPVEHNFLGSGGMGDFCDVKYNSSIP